MEKKNRGLRLASALLAGVLLAGMIPAAQAADQESSYSLLARLCAESASEKGPEEITFELGSTYMEVDGQRVPIDPGRSTTPQVRDQRTLLPARALVEALDGSISYENDVVTIIAPDETRVELSGNDPVMKVDGEEVLLDVAPIYYEGRTYDPVRAVTSSLGCEVDWNQTNERVTVTQPCQSRRLVVQAEGRLPETHPSKRLVLGEDMSVLVYDTVRETADALALLQETGVPAWPDEPLDTVLQGGASAETGWEDAHCGLSDFAATRGGDRQIKVAVIDSGIDASLPVFRDRICGGYDFLSGKSGIPADELGHGSFVSGLIVQYTPDQVQLLPLKTFGANPASAYLSIFLSALQYAQMEEVDLVNMSLSILVQSPAIEAAIRSLYDAGIAVVCSAGNQGTDTSSYIPAGLEETIVVAATDADDRPASFSNHGSTVDLSAPGVNIMSTGKNGVEQTQSGTSYSAPLVTAASAILLTEAPRTPAALERELRSMTVPFPSGVSGYGAGVLNLYGSLGEPEDSVPTPSPTPTPSPRPDPMPTPETPEAELTGFRWSHEYVDLAEGQSVSVYLFGRYSGDGKSWESDVTDQAQIISSDPDVVSVEEGGRITGLQPGSASLSFRFAVEDGYISIPATLRVTVEASRPPIEVERVTLSSQALNMTPGEKATLVAVVSPQEALDKTVSWTTSDSDVAEVRNGVVTTKAPGDCEIYATAGGKSAVCRVRVSENSAGEYSIQILSGSKEIVSGETGRFLLDVKTPLPKETGSRKLILHCGLYNRSASKDWLEFRSHYFDGGCEIVEYDLDTSMYDLPAGEYWMVLALFDADRFYTGAAITQTLQTIVLV